MCRIKGRGGLGRVKVGVGEVDEGKEGFGAQKHRRAGNIIILTMVPQSLDSLVKILPFIFVGVTSEYVLRYQHLLSTIYPEVLWVIYVIGPCELWN